MTSKQQYKIIQKQKIKHSEENWFYSKFMPKIYGIGAAVVIIGTLFKIQHLKGASILLCVGLITEALIFFLSAFEPKKKELDWSLVYPELADDNPPKNTLQRQDHPQRTSKQSLSSIIEQMNLSPDKIEKLGNNIEKFAESVNHITDISNATVSTNEYLQNLEKASLSLKNVNEVYTKIINNFESLEKMNANAQKYSLQLETLVSQMMELNNLYANETQKENLRLKNLDDFKKNILKAMEKIEDVSQESTSFKDVISELKEKVHTLSNIYTEMLAALKK